MSAALAAGWGHRTKIWKGTTQGPFHQGLVPIGEVVSEKKIKNNCRILFLAMAAILVGGRGRQDTVLKGDHPRTIPAKFGPNWPRGFRGED